MPLRYEIEMYSLQCLYYEPNETRFKTDGCQVSSLVQGGWRKREGVLSMGGIWGWEGIAMYSLQCLYYEPNETRFKTDGCQVSGLVHKGVCGGGAGGYGSGVGRDRDVQSAVFV